MKNDHYYDDSGLPGDNNIDNHIATDGSLGHQETDEVSSVVSDTSSRARIPVHMRPARTSHKSQSIGEGKMKRFLQSLAKPGEESTSTTPTCGPSPTHSRKNTATPYFPGEAGKYISTEARVAAVNNVLASAIKGGDLEEVPESMRSVLQSAQTELERAVLDKARLEGERDAIMEECQKALTDRAQLQSKVATLEGQVAANASTRAPETRTSEIAQLKDKVGSITAKYQSVQNALEKERQMTDELRRRLQTPPRKPQTPTHEEGGSGRVDTVRKLQARIESLCADMLELRNDLNEKKGEVVQLSQKDKLQTSTIESLEKANTWLRQQLDEGIESRAKLHQELHNVKSDKLSQSIQLEQAKKEANLHQQKVGELQKALLKDKAQLVKNLEAIEADVLSREDSYQNLTQERQGLEEQLERKDAEIELLDSALAEVKETAAVLQQEKDDVQDELNSVKGRLNDLEMENRRLLTAASPPVDTSDEKDDLLSKLNMEVGSLKGKNQALEVQLKQKEAELTHTLQDKELLEKEMEGKREELDFSQAELEEAKKRILDLETQVDSLNDSFTDNEEDLHSLKTSRDALTSEVHQLRKELAKKEEQLTQRVLQSQTVEGEVKDLVEQLGLLRTQYSKLEGGEDSYGTVLATTQKTIEDLKAENGSLETRLAHDQELIKRLKQDIGTLQQEKANLEGQLDTFTQHGTLGEEMNKIIKEKMALQGELREERMKGQKEMLKMQAKANRLENELKAATKDVSKLEKKLKRAQNDLSSEEKRDQRKDLEHQVEELSGRLRGAESERDMLMEDVQKAKEKESESRASRESLKKENRELAEHLHKLASQLESVEGIYQREVDELKKQAEEQRRSLNATVQELTLELERSRGRLSGMNHTQAAMRNHSSALEEALAEKESMVSELTLEVERMTEERDTDNSAFAKRSAELQEELETAKLQLQSSASQMHTQGKEVQNLRDEVAKQVQTIEDLEQKLTQVEGSDTDIDSKLADLTEANKQLENECSSLKSQLSSQATLVESFQREVKDKGQQVDYLSRELQACKMAAAEVQSEVENLKDYYRVSEERRQAEVDILQKELDEVLAERNSLCEKLPGKSGSRRMSLDGPQLTSSPLLSVSVSSLHSGTDQTSIVPSDSVLESVDLGGGTDNVSESTSTLSNLHDQLEKVEAMNDELRQSGQEAIGQALAYRQRLKQQENEIGRKIDDARRRGQEVAEVKKSAEINVLKNELTHKHRSMDKLQSTLSTLKKDMSRLQGQMDRHSQAVKASYMSSRQLENRLEDLRKTSSVVSPPLGSQN
jgi:chromosome segregation ATPase